MLQEDDVIDVHIEGGEDGVKVPACKPFLSAQSNVLKRMLYGNFKEGSTDSVTLKEYDGESTIRHMVYFCFNGKIEFEIKDEDSARKFARLYDCAHYLAMDNLKDYIQRTVKGSNCESKFLLCALYDESMRNPEVDDDPLMNIVINKMKLCDLKKGINFFGDHAIGHVLTKFEIVNDGEKLYLLEKWSKINGKERARNFVNLVNCEYIPPSTLAKHNFLDDDTLLHAYKSHALKAEQAIGNSFFLKGHNVFITGAGMQGVNGWYRSLNSKLTEFIHKTHKYRLNQVNKQWQICKFDDFFCYYYNNEGTSQPPKTGWISFNNSPNPPPTLSDF